MLYTEFGQEICWACVPLLEACSTFHGRQHTICPAVVKIPACVRANTETLFWFHHTCPPFLVRRTILIAGESRNGPINKDEDPTSTVLSSTSSFMAFRRSLVAWRRSRATLDRTRRIKVTLEFHQFPDFVFILDHGGRFLEGTCALVYDVISKRFGHGGNT